ncbi:hypothetical protein QFC22_005645 [Naganishia vaughanmartiniae]|uniref:Uncharacterized protein n=1 Tax=Naganishia vaughanmartiniae TaxID=1424756 RepID=A0ACC2WUE3_9TREE|nr:hypothetical protein QFC22_005645 [Naganishia vaughanmartiniae]
MGKPANIAPWAKSAHVLLGHVPAYLADPVKLLCEQRKLVGDVFRVDLLILKITFVIGADWNRWLLAEVQEANVSMYKAISFFSCGLLSDPLKSPVWITHMLKALRVGLNGPTRLQEITTECSKVALERFFPAWANRSKIPLFDSCSEILFDSHLTTFFGRRFADAHGLEIRSIYEATKVALLNPCSRVLPWWASPSGIALKRGSRRLTEIINAEVAERLQDLDTCREASDYLSGLIIANDTEGYSENYREHFELNKYNAHLAQSAYIALAQISIDNTCSWTLLHLLRNSDHLAAFEAEIRDSPPVDGIYPMKNMPFSEACLWETGRLYNNFLIIRYAQHDIRTPSGLIIPKGWVAISPAAVQMDPELYEEPGKWNPSRFYCSSSNGAATKSDTENASNSLYATVSRNYQFVQFGGGKHVCSGEKLTHLLLRASLWPSLLDNYHLELVHDDLVNGEGVDGVGVAPDHARNLGAAPPSTREVHIKMTRREVPLSSFAVHVA